ncbi:hypothetical protein KUH32_01205 [Thalassococcus sp. CAU 1522]|uniref:Anti-sigma factor NepR domain-containing protein n=1 Tax=Thalassococcus arenae TaxID=2851652 RepID=A0ABS6N2Y8_9RHOB|nr:NepR family anti-sigma factor [Thalassococcus arenae]MBV2358379.1 hypothetical protein [Thalassococcus arenae]
MNNVNRKEPKSKVVEEIDRNLKKAFEEMANEPVPQRFTDLLAQLKQAEAQGKGEETGNDD